MPASEISRRSVLRALGIGGGALAAGLPLAACGSNGSGGSGGGGGNASWMTWDTESGTPMYTMAQNWAKQAGKTLDIQSIPGDDYDTKLRTVLSSGAAPTAIRINDDYVRGYYAEGSLLDLRPYLEKDGIKPDDYFPVAYNFAKQPDGAHAAWPIMTNPGVLYCNTDAFAEAGVELPPKDWAKSGWTWDDFVEAAKKLTKPNGERWGALIFPDSSLETVFPVSNGGDGIYSKDATRFTLAEPQGTEAVQWVADLALVHKVHPDFATVTAGRQTPNWALAQLGTGKVAMLLGLTSGIPYLRKNAKVKWDIFPTPMKVRRTTVNTLTVLAVPKASKDPDTAWSFLKYAAGAEAAKLLAQSRGFMPVAKSSSALFVPDDKSPSNLALVTQALGNAVNENFSRYIERARTIYRPVLDDVWSGKKTAEAALGSVKQKVEDVLAGKG
ncbi:ABC transporter substrate-binding protein [Kribbella pratensis]|uniref:ABC-type glycerol-3-phosphate transport system substrate-binding protein n=1 Tax=Kribbella pratensis TaxID=2512112 RepID=A0A4R8CLD1_9ACTN|nr:sugar ABC transporter substrate-binding protein [Kribbella pratensis]TDW76839.1 ABC-type glycerol-3-phosphate transport system substrate-binding protein [Kribbella pratensis]